VVLIEKDIRYSVPLNLGTIVILEDSADTISLILSVILFNKVRPVHIFSSYIF